MDTFVYNDSNYNLEVGRSDGNSNFDIMLQNKWNLKVKEENVFWYPLKISKERNICRQFFLQLNIDRYLMKRPAASIHHINQPYNPDGFNFNKIRNEEKICFIFNENRNDESTKKDLIIVNVSPLEYGHILLVPNPEKCLPQVLTEGSLNLAVETSLLSNSSYFRICFNSLGAHASVNHLHFHAYYLKREMYLESAPVQKISGPCYTIENYPAKGFAFQIRKKEEIQFIVKKIFILVELLQHRNIPHNLYITRGSHFRTAVELSGDPELASTDCLRIYVWARKPSWGMKELSAFNIASCEFFGHMVIKNENDFVSLTYAEITDLLNDMTAEPYQSIISEVINLFNC